VFRGVPYAAAPVGELRLAAPRPAPPWNGTRLADAYGPVCPQRLPDLSNRTAAQQAVPRGRYLHLKKLLPLLQRQSEDCLSLNLFVPGSGQSTPNYHHMPFERFPRRTLIFKRGFILNR